MIVRVFVLVLVLGCSSTSTTVPPELQRALSDAIVARTAALAAASNADAYLADLKKYDRIFEGLEVYRRVPERWDAQGFQIALRDHLARHGMRLGAFTASDPSPFEHPALPATVPAKDGFPYQPAQIRVVVDVRFNATRADPAGARRWFDDRAALGPFLFLRKLKVAGGVVQVEGETYAFLPPAWPRYSTDAPDVAAALKNAGVTEPLEALRRGPHAETVREIESEYAQIERALPEIERGLQRVAESHFRGARYAFFKERAEAIERADFDVIISGPR